MIAPPLERLRAQTFFRTPLVRLGRFEASPDEPLFSEVSPPGHHLVAFPETELAISYERGGRFVVDPTVVTCYNPDDIYQRSAISPKGDRSTWISASPELILELLHALGEARPDSARIFEVPVRRCPTELFVEERAIVQHATNRDVDPLAVEERAISLLFDVLRSVGEKGRAEPPGCSRASRRVVERALDFLAGGFRESDTVDQIAAHAGCSPFHLCRAFRAQTGFSMHRYRTALRLRHGFDELLRERRGITELALDLGFSSHSHFTARFRREFGRTPRSVWGMAATAAPPRC